jgi:hypothetical protein
MERDLQNYSITKLLHSCLEIESKSHELSTLVSHIGTKASIN